MRATVRIALLSALGASVASVAAGCAGSISGDGSSARVYRRPEVDRLRLEKLEVVVVVAGPPRVAEDSFSVRTFEPPELDQQLLLGAEEPATRDALASALEARLRSAGFEIEIRTAAPRVATPAPAPPVSGSTTAPSSPAKPGEARLEGDVVHMPSERPIEPGATLRSVLDSSKADAVLVVRAVPVDAFVVDVGTGTRVERTEFGKETIRDFQPVRREGRLLVGQVFLFDQKTGLRLWTKQAPEYPDDGRLTPAHPFLEYGFVHEGPPPAPDGQTRARAAAAKFVAAMLKDFPGKSAGTERARAALTGLDPELDRQRQAFFDRGHLALEVDGSHGFETSEVSLALFEQPLEPLGLGAITPSGLPRVGLRASYLATGGGLWRVGLSYGAASSDFGRVYHLDNPSPNLMQPDDRTAHVRIGSVKAVGAEVGYGRFLQLSPVLSLVPVGGVTGEVWSLDAVPASVVTTGSRTRIGLRLGADVWLRFQPEGSVYLRAGAGGRGGVDLDGAGFIGYDLSLGAGILL